MGVGVTMVVATDVGVAVAAPGVGVACVVPTGVEVAVGVACVVAVAVAVGVAVGVADVLAVAVGVGVTSLRIVNESEQLFVDEVTSSAFGKLSGTLGATGSCLS